MAKIYYDRDANPQALADLPIGVIGYGNQGRAQALNLRDSGLSVWIGARAGGSAAERATNDGLSVHSIPEVVENCPFLALLLPDEVLTRIYPESIEPYIKSHVSFVFAHGFVIRHKTIKPPDDADVLMVAPTGPGRQLRSLFLDGRGLPALVAVDQDASGLAWERCLSYARAVGCTRAGAIATTFEEETVTDLFCEQAVLCGGMPELIKSSYLTLVENGYQPELAYISCLKEVKLIADLLFTAGIDGMRTAISNTAKYGSAIAGPELVDARSRQKLEHILKRIESGAFARQFLADAKVGSKELHDFVLAEEHSSLARTGRALRETLDF